MNLKYEFEEQQSGWGCFIWLFHIICATGWIFNVIHLYSIINNPVTGIMILRIAGIIILPLGSILGFIS